jgi:hypothetical protein
MLRFEEVATDLTFILHMPRRIVLLTLLCLLVFAGRAVHASPHDRTPDSKEIKRAESLLAKLHRLEETAASVDFDAFGKLAGKLYPGLFTNVSELRDGDLKTDLATAVTLYESTLRASREGIGAAPDCSRELRDSYSRLCLENRGGDLARLLLSKARLHARWAETELRYARGDRDAETLDAMSLISAERKTDTALAQEALHVLKELAEALSAGASSAASSARRALPREHVEPFSASLSGQLEEVERILASLPRDRVRQLLRNARDAFRDSLYLQLKVLPARSLVVNANYFNSPDTLPQTGLSTDDAERAALDNLRAAHKFITRAEEVLETANAER